MIVKPNAISNATATFRINPSMDPNKRAMQEVTNLCQDFSKGGAASGQLLWHDSHSPPFCASRAGRYQLFAMRFRTRLIAGLGLLHGGSGISGPDFVECQNVFPDFDFPKPCVQTLIRASGPPAQIAPE
jgi:hypothetical protein